MAKTTARAVLLITVAAGALALAACSSDAAPSATVTGGAGATFHTQRLVTGPEVNPGHAYSLDLQSAATSVHIIGTDLQGSLYRVSTAPSGSAIANATVTPDGAVSVTISGGSNGDVTIDVAENAIWTLRLSAGLSTATIDMSKSTLHGFTALAGISSLDITAGRPTGTVPISETGGLSSLALHVPTGTAARVQAIAGAGNVTLFGTAHSGVAAGTSFTSGAGADSYSVVATAGVSSIVVDATP